MSSPQVIHARNNWGLKLPSGKDQNPLPAAAEISPPEELTILLKQSPGGISVPMVKVGQKVFKGQKIAAPARNTFGSFLHAPVSGTVTSIIEANDSAHIKRAIIIANDGLDNVHDDCTPISNPFKRSPRFIRKHIAEGGIVGLGGAMFPAAIKLNPAPGIKTLLINGVECEPYINCDNQLLQQYPERVLSGTRLMLHVLGAEEAVIAIEQDMVHALMTMQAATEALNDPRIRVVSVPDVYPAGGERQLIEIITGLEVPHGGLPADLGVICQNAGTAAAIDQWINSGEPLISRMVTVCGNATAAAQNFVVRIGTPIDAIVNTLQASDVSRVIIGGSMMGVTADDTAEPISKASNCIILSSGDNFSPAPEEMPCIRCGDCVPVCPARINPQLLLESMSTNNTQQSESLGALDCIDCGCCDYVCPSGIDLTARFKVAKQTIWEQHLLAMRAERSQQRFADHEMRWLTASNEERETLDAQTAAFHDVKANNSKSALDDMLKRLNSSKQDDGTLKDEPRKNDEADQ